MTPEVRITMGEIAVRFLRVAQAWREEDQAAWDASRTQIGRALGMSLDEVACEIFAWLDEENEKEERSEDPRCV